MRGKKQRRKSGRCVCISHIVFSTPKRLFLLTQTVTSERLGSCRCGSLSYHFPGVQLIGGPISVSLSFGQCMTQLQRQLSWWYHTIPCHTKVWNIYIYIIYIYCSISIISNIFDVLDFRFHMFFCNRNIHVEVAHREVDIPYALWHVLMVTFCIFGGFLKCGYPKKTMGFNSIFKFWWFLKYPHCRKTPFRVVRVFYVMVL